MRPAASQRSGGVTLQIDRIRCDGHGACAGVLPERISLDEWGYPIIAAGPLPPELLTHARRAAGACPLQALRLADPAAPAGSGRRRP